MEEHVSPWYITGVGEQVKMTYLLARGRSSWADLTLSLAVIALIGLPALDVNIEYGT